LQLANNGTIEAGAVFTGGGVLRNLAGSELALLDGSELGVPLINEGTLSPGSSPGEAMVVGGYTQTDSGVLKAELGPGLQFDRLLVNGPVLLDGVLEIYVDDPAPGVVFNFLTGQISGMFDNVSVRSRVDTADGRGSFLFSCNGSSCTLSDFITNPVLAGDYNDDGIVNLADYTVWRDHLGAPAGTLPNDPHGVVIGQTQYDEWKGNFGISLGSSSLSNATVPEPTALMLIIVGSSLFAARLCRRFNSFPTND
jgi:hypothetical protein